MRPSPRRNSVVLTSPSAAVGAALLAVPLAVLLAGTTGCADDDTNLLLGDASRTDAGSSSGGDGGTDAGSDSDAGSGLCPGELELSGAYTDWDYAVNSEGPPTTLDTVITQVGAPQNTVTVSAPNGRVNLCVPANAPSIWSFRKDDYLPLNYTVEPAAVAGAIDMHGLTAIRADELFSTFPLTRDTTTAIVLISVRAAADRSDTTGAPMTEVPVDLGNDYAGSFADDDGDGSYTIASSVGTDGLIVFANVELTGGTTTVTLTQPAGLTCAGPSSLALSAGQIAATTFTCK